MELNKWVKATRSGNNGNCVSCMRLDDGTTLVRDDKIVGGPVLAFTATEWRAFVEGVQSGEFD